MNKKKKVIILILIIFLIQFLPSILSVILPSVSSFFTGEPTDKFLSEIKIEEDGSIKVRELIKMNGDYNGMDRDISYASYKNKPYNGNISAIRGNSDLYDGSGLTDVKVGSISDDGNLTFEDFNRSINYFNEVSFANNGESSKYTNNTFVNKVDLKLYNPSNLDEIFYIEYTVTDVVVVHEDIAELAWNTLGNGYRENIGDYEVKVKLPGNDSDYRVWLHGPLNGNIKRTNNKEALGTFNFLGAYNPVSIRLIFNKDLVPNATKTSGLTAKNEIINYQTRLSDQANAERDKIRLINALYITATIIWAIVSIVITLSIYFKEKKSKKNDFNMEYYRDFPASYGPEVLESLIDMKITEKSLSANVLNLIYKKVLKVEKVENKLKKDDYKLLIQKYDETSLSEPEKIALELMIKEIGDTREVVLSNIKDYCKDVNHAKKVISLFNEFVKISTKLGKNENFYTKIPYVKTKAFGIAMFGVLLTFIGFYLDLSKIAILIIIISVILFAFILTRRFFTKKGAEHYAKWMAHKRFLEDFSRFDEKELPEVALWDKYLVYAVILGNADKLSEQMKLKMPNVGTTNTTYIDYNPYMTNYLITSNLYRNINRGIHTAVSSSRTSIATSQRSSGSGLPGGGGGFGGGSIGGGGSFGGGGGGGRF